MSIAVDNQLLRKLMEQQSASQWNLLLEDSIKKGILPKETQNEIDFGWPNLLEYLDLGSLFENFFTFDESHQLFAYIISSLASDSKEELLMALFDQVFVECLTHIKALPQMDPAFLVDQIRKKEFSPLFSRSLNQYKKMLLDNPSNTMHNLILYLAWDRVCVNLAIIFERPATDLSTLKGLKVMCECLLESFQHITAQERTVPSFFRLLEALYAFEMRQENLDIHTDEEWKILCDGALSLKPRNEIADVLYLDSGIINVRDKKNVITLFTMEKAEKVRATKSLANYMIQKLKLTPIQYPVNVVCLHEKGDEFSIGHEIKIDKD